MSMSLPNTSGASELELTAALDFIPASLRFLLQLLRANFTLPRSLQTFVPLGIMKQSKLHG